jgi:hypothetical protein
MKIFRLALSVILVAALSVACVRTVKIRMPFIAAEAEYIRQAGNNTIDVNGFFTAKQRGHCSLRCI